MKIVFAGNCQAYALYFMFTRYFADALGCTAHWVDAWNEDQADECKTLIGAADLVLSQLFSGKTRVPIDSFCADRARIAFPDVRGNFLWPFGNVSRVDNPRPAFKGGGPYDTEVGDSFLNTLVTQNVAPEAALARYLDLDVAAAVNLDRIFEIMIDQQRARDEQTGIAVADYVERRFRDERLFNTPGHLNIGLFVHVAAQVYERLGVGPVQMAALTEDICKPPFEAYHDAPIHPQVAAHFRLTCVDESTRYHHVQEGKFSFAQRVIRYMGNEWTPELHEGWAIADSDRERALVLLDRGLLRAPGSAYGHNRKAAILLQLGRIAEAREAARSAVTIEPHDRDFAALFALTEHHAVH